VAAAAAAAAGAATVTSRLQLTPSRSCSRTCDKLSVDIVRDLSSPHCVVDTGEHSSVQRYSGKKSTKKPV